MVQEAEKPTPTPTEEETSQQEPMEEAAMGEEMTGEEMPSEAFDMMPDNLRRGDIVKGHIVKVTPEEVVVDVRLKSEGIIPLEEFQKPGEDLNLHVGQDIDVLIVRVEGKEGLPVLSHKKALEKQARIHLHEAYEQKEPVRCKIVEKTKGGFRVDMEGVSGFMPLSQSGVRRGDSSGLEDLIGKEVEAKVMELRSNRDPVFSRRAVFSAPRK